MFLIIRIYLAGWAEWYPRQIRMMEVSLRSTNKIWDICLKTGSCHHFVGGGGVMVAWSQRGCTVVRPIISVEKPNISVERPNIIVVQNHPKIGTNISETTKNIIMNSMTKPTAIHVQKYWSEKKIKDLGRCHGPGSWLPRCSQKA